MRIKKGKEKLQAMYDARTAHLTINVDIDLKRGGNGRDTTGKINSKRNAKKIWGQLAL